MAIFTWDRLTHSAAAAATDAPAPYDYQPIIDQVLDQLRDGSTRDAAERILRGIPEPALMIAKTDLATRGSDLPAMVTPEVTRILNQNHDARAGIRQGLAVDRKWNEGSAAAAYQIVGHRDPKWDDAALAAIRAHIGGRTATAFMNSASQAGCDDPLFVYCRMREIYTGESREGVAAWDAAADVLMASGYPAHFGPARSPIRPIFMACWWDGRLTTRRRRRWKNGFSRHWTYCPRRPKSPGYRPPLCTIWPIR
jgi:hypothetical protein